MPSGEILKDFREGHLHSGRGRTIKSGKNKGKRGKIVRNKAQAKAILLSYLQKEGKIPARKSARKRTNRKRVTVKA